MKKLRATGLDTFTAYLKTTRFGDLLGMQLMCNSTAEGNTQGLGIFDCEVSVSQKLKFRKWGGTLSDQRCAVRKHSSKRIHVFGAQLLCPTNRRNHIATTYGETYSTALQKRIFTGCSFIGEKQ